MTQGDQAPTRPTLPSRRRDIWWGVYCVQASWRRTHSATVFDGDQMLLGGSAGADADTACCRWLRLQCARPVMEIVLPYVADCSIMSLSRLYLLTSYCR